jgi:hypothetical protein
MRNSHRPSSRAPLARAVLLLAALSVPTAARAQSEANHLYDKFQFMAAGSDVVISPTIRIDGETQTGTDIEFGKTLGIGRSGFEPRLAIRWKPGRRHELEAGYLFINRKGENVLQDSVRVADTVFSAGLNLNSKFSADYAFLSYRFAIMAKPNTQLGLNLALGYIAFKIDINALAGASNGNDTLTTSYGVSKSFPGPVATLGLYGRFRFSEKWYLEADGAYLTASASNIKVTEYVIGAAGRYFLSNKIGLEAGYGITSVDLHINNTGSGSGGVIDPGTIQGKIGYNFQNFRLGVILALQ